MPQSDASLEPRSLGAASLANLSLGAAFALSSVFSIGAKLVGTLGVRPLLALLQPYQQQLMLAFMGYWLPATLIYVLFRLLRLDDKLRPTVLAQSTIFCGNALFLLYVTVRTFAATVEGGGGSFVVASLSPFVIVPAWGFFLVGFIALVRSHSGPTTRPRRHRDHIDSSNPIHC